MFAPASRPLLWVRSCLTVICDFSVELNSGRYEPTVRPRSSCPPSSRIMATVVVAMTFVRDARSYSVLVSTAGEPGLFQSIVP